MVLLKGNEKSTINRRWGVESHLHRFLVLDFQATEERYIIQAVYLTISFVRGRTRIHLGSIVSKTGTEDGQCA